MGKVVAETGRKPSPWRHALKVIAAVLAYMLPLFWLWTKIGYPDSLGVHIAARGKAGLLENWWYSYLLLERHRAWDVVAFLYMWAAVVGVAAWLGWAVVKDRKTGPNTETEG